MNDIKVYAPIQTKLKRLQKIWKHSTTDIQMEFGISKCKELYIENGKWKGIENRETITIKPQIILQKTKHTNTWDFNRILGLITHTSKHI